MFTNSNAARGLRDRAKRLTKLLISAIAFSSFFGVIARAEETSIKVAYVPAGDFLPLYVGMEKGYFAERGLKVTLVPIPSMPDMAGAVFSGSVQIGAATGPVFIQAVSGGLDLVAISGASRMTAEKPIAGLLARSGANINSAADLVGKRVAVPGLGSFLDIFFRNWLTKKGVDFKKVQLVEGIHPQMGDLLKGGTVDAVITVEPFMSFITKSGNGKLVSNYVAELNPDIAVNFWMANRTWAEQNPKIATAFKAGWSKGIDFVGTNVDDAREIERKYLKINSPVLPKFFVDISEDDLNVNKTLMSNVGISANGFDAKKSIFK